MLDERVVDGILDSPAALDPLDLVSGNRASALFFGRAEEELLGVVPDVLAVWASNKASNGCAESPTFPPVRVLTRQME